MGWKLSYLLLLVLGASAANGSRSSQRVLRGADHQAQRTESGEIALPAEPGSEAAPQTEASRPLLGSEQEQSASQTSEEQSAVENTSQGSGIPPPSTGAKGGSYSDPADAAALNCKTQDGRCCVNAIGTTIYPLKTYSACQATSQKNPEKTCTLAFIHWDGTVVCKDTVDNTGTCCQSIQGDVLSGSVSNAKCKAKSSSVKTCKQCWLDSPGHLDCLDSSWADQQPPYKLPHGDPNPSAPKSPDGRCCANAVGGPIQPMKSYPSCQATNKASPGKACPLCYVFDDGTTACEENEDGTGLCCQSFQGDMMTQTVFNPKCQQQAHTNPKSTCSVCDLDVTSQVVCMDGQ